MNGNRKVKRVVASVMASMMVTTVVPADTFHIALPSVVKAEELLNVDDGNFEIVDGVLKHYNGEDTAVKIPEGVITIGEFCFSDSKVTSVEIPDTVKTIEYCAFCQCENLETVTIPGSVLEIGESAFSNCRNLKTITLNSGLQKIGKYAFYRTALENVTIPGTVQVVGDSTFSRCMELQNVVVEEGVTTIEESAFYMSGIQTVSLPGTLLQLGESAFYECENLTDASIGGGNIGRDAFYGCTALKNLKLSQGVTNIERSAFGKCTALKEVTIPGTVEKVGDNAFEKCEALEKLVFQDGVKEIGMFAFAKLEKLKSITFAEGLQKIGYAAFQEDTALELVDIKSAESMEWGVFDGCSNIKEVVLRSGVKQVGESCFHELKKLEKLTIEAGVEQIGKYAFLDSTKLTELELPSSIAVVGDSAFLDCQNLEKVTMPATIKYMGSSSFAGTRWYERLMHGTETAETQDDGSVKYSYGYDTTGKYVVAGNVLLGLADDFDERTDTVDQLPEGVNVIADLRDWRVDEVVVPEGVISLGDQSIDSGVKKITIPDSVTYLGDSLCFANRELKEIKLPAYIETIPARSFYSCDALEDITIPEHVKMIEECAFEYCTALTSVTLPEGLTYIGDHAFEGCSGISTFTIPAGVTHIGYGAFAECGGKEGNVTIKGYTGSVAESYAKEYGYQFVSIGVIDPEAEATSTPVPTLEPKPTAPVVTEAPLATPVVELKTQAPTETPVVETENPTTEPEEAPVSTEEVAETPKATKQAAEPAETPGADWSMQMGVEKKGYVITLDANGGTLENHYVTVINGDTYGNLPAPSKAGHQFLGWYTEREDGTKMENGTTVNLSSDQTLYAHWAAEKCIVSFDSNGGFLVSNKASYQYGDVYGVLPEPAAEENQTFLGWYTAKEGGTLITEDMVVEMTGEITLYAHWQEKFQAATADSLTYAFGNTASSFHYASGYRIPLSVYQYMYGNSQYAETLYDNTAKWGGSCYGLSTTSIFFNTNTDDVELTDFAAKAAKVSDLDVSDVNSQSRLSLKRFIEVMHVSQYDSSVTGKIYENMNNLTEVYNDAAKAQEEKGEPIIICLYGPQGGHAVVGYKAEKESTEKENGRYEGKIALYDPNFPQDENRYIDVELDSSDNVIYWHYKINDTYDWSSDVQGCNISYIPYETFYQMWEKNGTKTYDAMDMVTLNTQNAIIYDAAGVKVATVENGTLVSDAPDITQLVDAQVTEESSADGSVKLFIPAEKYTFENTGSNKDLTISVMGTDATAQVDTQSKKVTVNLDEITSNNQVQIATEQGTDYTVNLQSMSTNDKKEVVVEGTGTGKQISVSQKQGDVQLNRCENATVKVNGKVVKYYDITANAGKGGSISREGTVGTLSGEEIVYAFTPDFGYMVKDVVVDGVSQGNIASYIFDNVNASHTISVTFEEADIAKAKVYAYQNGKNAELQVCIGKKLLVEGDDYKVTSKEVSGKKVTCTISGISYFHGTLTTTVDMTGAPDASITETEKPTNTVEPQNTPDPSEEPKRTIAPAESFAPSDHPEEPEETSSPTPTDAPSVQQGKTYKSSNFYYKVTSLSKKTVTVTKKAKSAKTVTVPATVKIKGKTFKVTGIGSNVWKNDKKLTSVIIGKNVTSIGANAFYGAKNLKKITVQSTSLKKVGSKALKNISAKAVIKVPAKKKAAYKKLFKGKGQKKTVKIK